MLERIISYGKIITNIAHHWNCLLIFDNLGDDSTRKWVLELPVYSDD